MTRNPKQNKRPEDKCLLAKAIGVKIHQAIVAGRLEKDPVRRGGLRGLFDPHCSEWGAGDIVAKVEAMGHIYQATGVLPRDIAEAVEELMQESHGYPKGEARQATHDAYEVYLQWQVLAPGRAPAPKAADVDAADDEIDGGS